MTVPTEALDLAIDGFLKVIRQRDQARAIAVELEQMVDAAYKSGYDTGRMHAGGRPAPQFPPPHHPTERKPA